MDFARELNLTEHQMLPRIGMWLGRMRSMHARLTTNGELTGRYPNLERAWFEPGSIGSNDDRTVPGREPEADLAPD
jgi:hypothetical protein